MITLLLDHLWQSTWFVLAVALLAWPLRKNGAHVRYGLWLTASAKFLVPFSLLTFAGSQIGVGSNQHPHFEKLNRLVEVSVAPASARSSSHMQAQPDSASTAKSPASGVIAKPDVLMRTQPSGYTRFVRIGGWIWLGGACAVFLLWLSRWLQLRWLVRNAVPSRSPALHGMPMPVLESASSVEPGIAGIFRPVLLLPRGIVERLSPSQLSAVLEHELAHWRRRDNLTASIQMVVEAVFWFHPLVWWVGAQLVREREQACDEAVVRHTGTPYDYAEGILNICQYYVAPPLRTAAISGGDLRQRIQRITANLTPEGLDMTRKAVLATLASIIVVAPILLGTARAAPEPTMDADHSGLESLYAAAKREGEVLVMVIDPRDSNWIPTAFGREFPGIKVHIMDSLGQLPVVISDAESRRPRFDMIQTSLMEGNSLNEGGYLADVDWMPFKIPANRIGLNGRFAYTNNIVFTVAYDERRVAKEGLPATWRDLLDPRYRGILSTNPFVMPRIIAGLGLAWGENEARNYALQIKSQEMVSQWGDVRPLFLDQKMAQRYFIGMPNTVTEQWKSAGEPSGYVVPEPVIMEQQGTAVLRAAPHPAAARLLAGWLATERAKAIRHREAQSSDLLPDSSDPLAVALHARQVRIVYDTPDTAGERIRLAGILDAIFSSESNVYNRYGRAPPTSVPFLLDGPK